MHVRDLKKEDFQVLEDGKAPDDQRLHATSTFPIERCDRPLFAASPIEPDVKTNERPFDGRVYVMVIDDLHTRFGRSARVKIAAKQFIERRLGANDLMADGPHRRRRPTPTRSSRATRSCCSRRWTRRMGRKLDSATAEQGHRA